MAIAALDYALHRKRLMARLSDGPIFLLGGVEVPRNSDVSYPFRQESNFLYLTGIESPGYALLLNPKRGDIHLFIPRIDAHHRVWEGQVPDLAESRRQFGIATVHHLDEAPTLLKKIWTGRSPLYTDTRGLSHLKRWRLKGPTRTADFADALAELRATKTDGEIAMIRRANAASAKGHLAAMAAARPGLFEYEIQAILEAEFRRAGLPHNAYGSIVAAGRNSAILHYRDNRARLKNSDWLLIDAGAECCGYASDVTRTFPVNGRFSDRARAIYEIALRAQETAILAMRPGALMRDLHLASARTILDGLRELKMVKGDLDTLLETGVDRLFYPHGLSHTLGLDVHDVTGGKRRQIRLAPSTVRPLRFDRKLEAGFVVTAEPGLYFIPALLRDPQNRRRHRGRVDFDRAEKWISLGGVRIEDDIWVTPKGPVNLTPLVKSISDIEAACR